MNRINRVLFLIILIVCSYSLSAAKNYTVFDIVGDSISAGFNPTYSTASATYGWVQMLFGQGGTPYPAPKPNTIYTLWSGITVYNSAQSGSKAYEWAADYNAWLTGVKNHHPDLVVVYIGGNDFLAYSALGPITNDELTTYRNNLRTIVDSLHNNTPRPDIILVNYYDLFDGNSANLLSIFSAYTALSETAIRGNQVIEEVALERGCYLVTVYSDFMHHCYGIYLGDTQHLPPDYVKQPLTNFDIHPNTNGHSKIYDKVYAQLVTLKNKTTSINNWMLYN
jgi:lysophospholipase L1-like esterase